MMDYSCVTVIHYKCNCIWK